MPYYMNEVHPDYTAASSLLQHLSNDELKRLLNEDQELDEMVKDLEQVKNIEAERVMLLASNKNLAEFNLNREPSMLETRQQLAHMYSEALELKKEVEEKKQKLEEKGRQVSLDTTLAILQTSAAQSEEETEEMADKLLNRDIPVEEFIEKYLEKRKIAHLRKVKAEKMAELLAQKRNQSINMFSSSHYQAGNRSSRPPPAPPFYPNPPMAQPLYGPGVMTPPLYGVPPAMRMPMPSYK